LDVTSYISFPGLNIGEFIVKSTAFNLFGRNIAWYGIIITIGIFSGFMYMVYRSRFEGILTDDIFDLGIFVIIFAMIGARAYYVLMNLKSYDTFLKVISVWNGGLAIYGGIIAGGLTLWIVCMVKKLQVGKLFDMIGPATMLGQLIGRWGNFFNAEAFGGETDLPWRMGIRNEYHPETIFVHPTFFYEAVWNLIGFIILNIIYKKKKFNGQIFIMYVIWYGFGRMFIEGLRADSLYIGNIRVSQLVAFASFIIGIILLVIFTIRSSSDKNIKL
jgi:phosphatidylglycerol:prolipoprotein diacylglycerol transferase